MTDSAQAKPLRLEYLDARDLGENPSNWRLHPKEQMSALDTAIGEVGWAGALLFNEQTNRLLDGHARRKLFAEKGGMVPVLIGSWDEETEKKILATLDPLGDMAATDQGMLENLLTAIGGTSALGSMLDEITGVGFKAQTAKLVDLKFHPRNYKRHPDDQIAHLMQSITEHGFYRNVVVARENTILAGQGVVQAAAKMGFKQIPVIRLDLDPNEPRALKVLTSDNEIGKLGETDDRALTELLKEIMQKDSLDGTGYDAQRLAGLLYVTRPANEIRDTNQAAEWIGLPGYETAEVPWKLVVSFDSAEKREEFVKLMGVEAISKTATPAKGAESKKTWATHWPPRPNLDAAALRFDTAQDKP